MARLFASHNMKYHQISTNHRSRHRKHHPQLWKSLYSLYNPYIKSFIILSIFWSPWFGTRPGPELPAAFCDLFSEMFSSPLRRQHAGEVGSGILFQRWRPPHLNDFAVPQNHHEVIVMKRRLGRLTTRILRFFGWSQVPHGFCCHAARSKWLLTPIIKHQSNKTGKIIQLRKKNAKLLKLLVLRLKIWCKSWRSDGSWKKWR